MPRVLIAVVGLTLALGLFGCSPSKPSIDTQAWSKRLNAAVLAVPGVTGGDVRMITSGPVSEPKIICNVTSKAETKADLVATLENVLRQVVAETKDLDSMLVEASVANGHDTARLSDLDVVGTLGNLRKRFA